MLLPGHPRKTVVLLTFVGVFRDVTPRIPDHDKPEADQTASFGLDHLALPQEGQALRLSRRKEAAAVHKPVEVAQQVVRGRTGSTSDQTVFE